MSDIKATFDPRKPADYDPLSASDMRNLFNALYQGDIAPLRPRCHYDIEPMEYPSDGAASAVWSGTGCTVTSNNTNNREGSYCIQVAVDATGNREVSRTWSGDISGFRDVRVWVRANAVSDIQFFIEDNTGNRSYWNISIASADTWAQYTLTLSSPDGNNGANATLSDVAVIGYQGLDASTTYLFDLIEARTGLNVYVSGAFAGDNYYRQVWFGNSILTFSGGLSPDITPPSTYPRIDLLSLSPDGSLVITQGTENIAPSPPDIPTGHFPICYIYCKPTMSCIVDYEEKDDYADEGYIYADIRRFFIVGAHPILVVQNYGDIPASMPSGTLAYVTSEPNLYIKTASGWELLDRRDIHSYLQVRGDNAPGGDVVLSLGADTPQELSITLEQGYDDEPHIKWYPTGDPRRKFVLSEGAPTGTGTEYPIATIPIQTDDLADAIITTAKLVDASVSTVKLHTATGSITHGSAQGENAIGYELASSEYQFYPRIEVGGIGDAEYRVMGAGGYITFAYEGHWIYGAPRAIINVKRTGFTEDIIVHYRYITGTSDAHWVYLLVEKDTDEILAVWEADDPPTGAHPFHRIDPDKHIVVLIDDIPDKLKGRRNRRHLGLRLIREYRVDWASAPPYRPRHSIILDEFCEIECELVRELADGRRIVKRIYDRIPEGVEFKRIVRKG